MFSKWDIWEAEYLKRGFRSLPIDEFISAGGYSREIDDQIMLRRKPEERAVSHAQIYKERYLGKVERFIHLEKVIEGQIQQGHWHRPTTVDAVAH